MICLLTWSDRPLQSLGGVWVRENIVISRPYLLCGPEMKIAWLFRTIS